MKKSRSEIDLQVGKLVDSDEFCDIYYCPFMAQWQFVGTSRRWRFCSAHLAEVLSDWENINIEVIE
jgi:hypothetical protein